ncbi:MAG: right-handed parallel beta-helix repeat-containing protein, partial [Haloferacaceae archaeon]|nr:right-handed parallel beta-helix repeat-containing protein [Haloferacaceae archaeon]
MGTVVVDKPVTIQGSGPETVIDGDGMGTPVIVRAADVSIRDLQITGVGPVGARSSDEQQADWDASIQLAYGGGDAAIVVDGVPRTRIESVLIETPASGIIGREAESMLVRDVEIHGSSTADAGFMGVIVIGAPALIDEVTISGGRDGVYTHRADGTVIRESTLAANRYGTHLMYTSGAVISNNTIDGGDAGVMIMTRPVGNLVIGNRITDSEYGIVPAGGDSYIAQNTVTGSGFGIQIAG